MTHQKKGLGNPTANKDFQKAETLCKEISQAIYTFVGKPITMDTISIESSVSGWMQLSVMYKPHETKK